MITDHFQLAMKRNAALLLVASLSTLFACKKTEGPGGSSSITGKVTGVDHSSAQAEITDIICTNGMLIDDNDYFLLNSPDGNQLYYVWFDNTNWLGGDPGLTGRTGIKVVYEYAYTNYQIASGIATAIQSIAGGTYDVTQVNDIVTLTCKQKGQVADAHDINSPMILDIRQQGKNGYTSGSQVMAEERVYIIFGDNTVYSDDARTDGNGVYQFTGLTKGKYKLYTFTKDTVNNTTVQVSTEVEITKNKQLVEASDMEIVK